MRGKGGRVGTTRETEMEREGDGGRKGRGRESERERNGLPRTRFDNGPETNKCVLNMVIFPIALAGFHLLLRSHKNPCSHSTNITGAQLGSRPSAAWWAIRRLVVRGNKEE